MPLKEYEQKRDFGKTAEPQAKARLDGPAEAVFVVQKHKSTRLHYDFRLEVDGVLKSWAIPKGPSLNPSQKRLAVMVEDHPYDYKDFEGVIPQGEYGAGTVMIWDEGAYAVAEGDPAGALEAGVMKFELDGKKLKGTFSLVHTRMGGKDQNWLLIKGKDDHAGREGDILEEEPDSARTGRSLEQITEQEPGEK